MEEEGQTEWAGQSEPGVPMLYVGKEWLSLLTKEAGAATVLKLIELHLHVAL